MGAFAVIPFTLHFFVSGWHSISGVFLDLLVFELGVPVILTCGGGFEESALKSY